MQLHWQICLVLLCASTDCSPAALPAVNTVNQNPKLSAIPDLPGQGFSYDAAYTLPRITPIASIMACIAAMHDLVLLNWDSYIGDSRTWTHPNYPEVSVIVDDVGGSKCTVRFALWLMQAAIRDMMIRNRYRTAAFLGRYQRVLVGRLQFVRNPITGGEKLGTPTETNLSNETSGSNVSFRFELPSAPGRVISNDPLGARVDYLDKRMDMRDTYLTIIWLLMAFGSRGYQHLRIFHCNVKSLTVEVMTIWTNVSHPPRGQQPLTTADMVNMVAQLALAVQRDHRYWEMNIFIYEDGLETARGAIRTRPLPGGLVVPLTANVTVA
ncbi:MAG: hypothetical protein LQ337_008039 [Flavoplaca oasis]|nr:MAG: hypothetical protein LQ337_008039 [Flavoplaca oasis]